MRLDYLSFIPSYLGLCACFFGWLTVAQMQVFDPGFLQSKVSLFIPNGIPDVAGSEAVEIQRQHPKPTLLYMGSLLEDKGVLVLLEACSHLKAGGELFQCIMAGQADSPDFQKRLERRRAELNLEEEIIFSGQVVGAAKWDLFRQADIFCFPTFYTSESFGLVVVEAMQWALPCVVTDWRALPGIVVEGETGLLVPPQNAEALACELKKLLKDPSRRESMGRAGRKRFEEEYAVEIFRKRMERGLSELGAAGRTDEC
jgi:glycosyltransferase involved in cell wall biosynthesis